MAEMFGKSTLCIILTTDRLAPKCFPNVLDGLWYSGSIVGCINEVTEYWDG